MPTPDEWLDQIPKDLDAAGFTWRWKSGFPLVAMPKAQDDRVRLIKLPLTYACEKRIYAEGMLILPPEVAIALDEAKRHAG